MRGFPLIQCAWETLKKEEPEVYTRWLRDGVANVQQLAWQPESGILGVTENVLENPTPREQHLVLSYLLELTLRIQSHLHEVEGVERLLVVGSEARAKARFRVQQDSTAVHTLEAHRPTFTKQWPDFESVEEFHICTEHAIIDEMSYQLREEPTAVLETTMAEQSKERLKRFENPPEGVTRNERIENFLQSAQLLTLIGNVTDYTLDEGIAIASEYYANVELDELTPESLTIHTAKDD
jgi:hypothetical protein